MKTATKLLGLLLLVSMVVLSACGGQAGNQAGTQPTNQTGQQTGDATPQPTEVVIGLNADAQSLDPVLTMDATTIRVLRHIYDPLFFRDDKMAVQPELASGAKMTDDTTWEITLRKGIKFQNGEPFNADAVIYNLNFILDPDNNALTRSLISRISSVEKVDDYTVRVKTSEPFPTLRENLTEVFMAPPKFAQENGMQALSDTPIGTGPYKLESWNKEQAITLVKNPDYWKGDPKIDRVVFKIIPEVSARVDALLAGEVDIIPDVPPNMIDQVNSSGIATVKGVAGRRAIFVQFNTYQENTPVTDVRVRKALNYAVNVPEVIDTVLQGNATRTPGPLIAINKDFDPDLQPIPYDPEKAVELLNEAGYSESNPLSLQYASPNGRYLKDYESNQALAQQMMDSVPFLNIDLKTYEWGTYLDMMKTRKIEELHMNGRSDRELDGGILYAWGTTGASWVSFSIPELDSVLKDAVSIIDPTARHKAIQEAQKVFQDNAPWIFLWEQHDLYGVNNRVEWQPRADEQFYLFNAQVKTQ